MSEGGSEAPDAARPATVDDLKRLLAALAHEGVDYVLIGGYALYALGYQRATTDIDLLMQPTTEQGQRARRALMTLPAGVAEALDPEWFAQGETIRVADAFVVDLMFSACGESLDTLRAHIVSVDRVCSRPSRPRVTKTSSTGWCWSARWLCCVAATKPSRRPAATPALVALQYVQ